MRAGSKENENLGIDLPFRKNKIRLTKNRIPSQNVTKKFSKWPYFTICTAPSTVKSKHLRTGTTAVIPNQKERIGEKTVLSMGSTSHSRPRSNSKKSKKLGGVNSTNKSIERDLLSNKFNYCE